MTDKQPEALRLADALDSDLSAEWMQGITLKHISNELRRLHEENEALRARLAQPEQEIEPDRDHVEDDGCPTEKSVLQKFWREHQMQEPVAWCIVDENGRVHGLVKTKPAVMNAERWQPLYTAPPQREWQGLTDEELLDIADMAYANDLELLQTLQAKLKEKNNG